MDDAIIALSRYRMNESKQCIKSAKVLVEFDDYKGKFARTLTLFN